MASRTLRIENRGGQMVFRGGPVVGLRPVNELAVECRFRVDLMCADWDAPAVRELRGSSRAVTGFIAKIAAAAGDIPEGKAVRVRLTGARVVKIGKGTSADIGFEVAPADKWPDATAFDAHRDAPEAAPPAPPAPAKSAWDEIEDDGEF